MHRKKTGSIISVPILPKAEQILEKYKGELPKISNQRFNSYLKEVADILGIGNKLTHHVDRKTFATTILFYNEVPMEIVSELLGHSRLQVTQQHYVRVVKTKVRNEVDELAEKLNENN